MMEDEPKVEGKKTAKFVIIGDGSVGKTCVCNTYANKKFPEDYVPTVFENHNSKHTFDGEVIQLNLKAVQLMEKY
jgi:small GTP-binding protein